LRALGERGYHARAVVWEGKQRGSRATQGSKRSSSARIYFRGGCRLVGADMHRHGDSPSRRQKPGLPIQHIRPADRQSGQSACVI